MATSFELERAVLLTRTWEPYEMTPWFWGWLQRFRPEAWDVLNDVRHTLRGTVMMTEHDGGWLLQFPNLSYKQLPDEARWCFWHGCHPTNNDLYMYLRSHPDELGKV